MTREKYSNALVKEKALAAMKKAGKDYALWTKQNVHPLYVSHPLYAPEYIYTVGIARALANLKIKPGVFCEHNASDAISEATLTPYGRKLSKITKRSRADIIVTRQDLTPMFVIEVKNLIHSNTESFKEAVKRVADIVGPKGATTIPSGMVLFNVPSTVGKSPAEAKAKLEDRIEKLRKAAQDSLSRRKLFYPVPVPKIASVSPESDDTGFWCWTSCALIIESGLER